MSNKKDYLLEDDEDIILDANKSVSSNGESALEKQQKAFRKTLCNTTIILTIGSLLLIAFGLVWQQRFDLWAISNALWLAFAIEFFIAWIIFVHNHNILSPLLHGFKVFGLMMVGKRSKESYYDYKMRIEENPIPKYIYYMIYLFAFLLLIPAVITMLMI